MGAFPTMARSGGNRRKLPAETFREADRIVRLSFGVHSRICRRCISNNRDDGSAEMKIVDVKAYPTSFRVPKDRQVSLGIGTMTKRDCVMVKVTTEDGITGWGESHHARSPGSIGHLINTTLKG